MPANKNVFMKVDFGLIVLLAFVIYLFYQLTDARIETERDLALKMVQSQLELKQRILQEFLARTLDHIDGLASEKVARRVIENGVAEGRVQLEESFRTLLLRNPDYAQVRWIDGSGMEIVRVEQNNQTIRVLHESELTDKAGRYYTQNVLQLKPGGFYISPLDLNVDGGLVEQPYRPMIRIARRLPESKQGEDQGFLIINVAMKRKLNDLLLESELHQFWMLNHNGEWLRGPEKRLEWQFMFGRSETIEQRYPGALATIRSQSLESFDDGEGGQIAFSGLSLSELMTEGVAADESLYLLNHVSAEHYQSVGMGARQGFYLLVLLLLIASTVIYLIILKSRRQFNQLVLAHAENRALHNSEEQLQHLVDEKTRELRRLNRNLEQQVEERTAQVVERNNDLEQLQLALDQHAIVSAADTDGNIIFVNDKFCEISGYSRGELLGQNHRIVKSGEHPPAFYQTLWETITSGEVWHGEVKNLKKGGKECYWVQATIVPMTDVDGGITQYVSIRTDITQRKEDELELQEAARKIEETSRAREDFLASMSHELRTPLTAIIGNSELLAEMEEDQQKQRLIHIIDQAANSQLSLVNDILDVSKIDSGQFTIDEVEYDLEALLQSIHSMMDVRAKDAAIQLEFIQQEPLQWLLRGDSQRIGQILINLIGNAIKFTEQGSITITTQVRAQQLRITVKDTGIGMAPEVVEQLFQRFRQADSSISRSYGGSGLGLFISQTLAEMMGGNIEVSSTTGVGSIFVLTLPYQQSSTAIDRNRKLDRAPVINTNFEGHVLVADDSDILQLLERSMLEQLGLQVTIAENGEEAVALATLQPFDLIFMDMQMPVMDGIEATKKLRAQGVETPIVALTANAMQKHRDAFKKAGCDGYLTKPFDKLQMIKMLQQYL